MANELKFDMLGTSFTIIVDENPEYLDKIMKHYQAAMDNIQKITGYVNPLNIAILTGYMLCEEIYKERQQCDDFGAEVEKRAHNLINKLEQALKTCDKPAGFKNVENIPITQSNTTL